jgi:hypothetical protein
MRQTKKYFLIVFAFTSSFQQLLNASANLWQSLEIEQLSKKSR